MAQVIQQNTDSLATDSINVITQASDTVPTEPVRGLLLERTEHPLEASERHESVAVNSWLLGGMCLIFCIVCLRYKNNSKYFHTIFADLTDTKERHNMFDDTVRETSFLFLANFLNACSMGLLLYESLSIFIPEFAGSSRVATLSILTMLAYNIIMPFIYRFTGEVFTDSVKAKMWTKGFFASNAVMSLALFPSSLVALFYPGVEKEILIFAGVIFLLVKTLFVIKGFRIFMDSRSSWILMLYYLVGVEIVPLIVAAITAIRLS